MQNINQANKMTLNPGVSFLVKGRQCLLYLNWKFSFLLLEDVAKEWFCLLANKTTKCKAKAIKEHKIKKGFISWLLKENIFIPQFELDYNNVKQDDQD